MDLNIYMKNNEHLPEFMKDFHDQKDLFKAIYTQWKSEDPEQKNILDDVNWIDTHVFTIDFFLWWMGLHGYKLQKSKKKNIKFHDPIETIEHHNSIRRGKEVDLLKNILK